MISWTVSTMKAIFSPPLNLFSDLLFGAENGLTEDTFDSKHYFLYKICLVLIRFFIIILN